MSSSQSSDDEDRSLLTTASGAVDATAASCWPRRSAGDGPWLGVGFFVVSFLSFFKMAEPFLASYLQDSKHLSSQAIYQSIFPLWTYSQLGWLLLFGVLSEFVTGCKWIVVAGVFCLYLEAVILVEATELWAFQLVEAIAGGGAAAMVLFSAYCYRVFAPGYYQQVTSWTRAGFLLGTVSSSLLGQVLRDQLGVTVQTLYWATAGVMLLCDAVVVFLPGDGRLARRRRRTAAPLHRQLVAVLRCWQPIVVPTLWLVVSTAVHTLVLTYYQVLFLAIAPNVNYNGYVEAVSYVLAAAVTALPGVMHRRFAFRRPALLAAWLAGTAFASALLLVVMSLLSSSIGWAYALFIVYHSVFEFACSVATAQIAVLLDAWVIDKQSHQPLIDSSIQLNSFDQQQLNSSIPLNSYDQQQLNSSIPLNSIDQQQFNSSIQLNSYDQQLNSSIPLNSYDQQFNSSIPLNSFDQQQLNSSIPLNSFDQHQSPPPISIVFSTNNVLTLLTQSLLQFVVGKHALGLSIRHYFLTFGCVLGGLSVLVPLLAVAVHRLARKRS